MKVMFLTCPCIVHTTVISSSDRKGISPDKSARGSRKVLVVCENNRFILFIIIVIGFPLTLFGQTHYVKILENSIPYQRQWWQKASW